MWSAFLLLSGMASAQDVTSDSCGEQWADYFNAGINSEAEPSGNAVFRALDAVSSIGKPKRREVVVSSCSAGEPRSSNIYDWHGEVRYSAAGTPVVLGVCTQVDVVEVQGRRRDRCRRFPTSRICQHVDNPSNIAILVGQSQVVPCEDDAG